MNSRTLDAGGQTYHVLVLEPDDEAVAAMLAYARAQNIRGGRITALGAFSDAVLGFFDFEKKDYHEIRVAEQVEVASLVGDFAMSDDAPQLHAHCVVSRRDGSALGGHLLSAHVNPTLEIMVTELPQALHRKFDPETGVALLQHL